MFEIEVAVPVPLPGTFTYLSEKMPPPGIRVMVPFGARKLIGVALGPAKSPPETQKLRRIEKVIDEVPIYSPAMLELARWLSTYYLHPLGEVLKAMLPASDTKSSGSHAILTDSGQIERASGFSPEGRVLRKCFGLKKDAMPSVTFRRKFKALLDLSDEDAGATSAETVVKLGLVQIQKHKKITSRSMLTPATTRDRGQSEQQPEQSPPLLLTTLQKAAFDRIVDEGLNIGGVSQPFLLHGVTGSGKTEIYLHLIAETLRRSKNHHQVLVLVPEISLTPQMTRIFEGRFPGLVAVVHSAMADHERWAQLTRIRENQAKILIGPRSAIFAPFAHLKAIIVDEEHDGSYKQSTGLTYNGRDVAVLRGRIEKAFVVLGSATPSMESYQNALSDRYTLIELTERVTGRSLPQIELIASTESTPSKRSGTLISRNTTTTNDIPTEIPIATQVLEELRANLAEKHQAIVLVNRRGYAFYLFSLQQQKTVQCPECSISLTLHARSTVLRCHYCDYSTTTERLLRDRPQETFVAVGYGSQKAEDYLAQELKEARITRIDSDSIVKQDVLPRVLNDFRNGKIDVLVGTQILAKGHDFPNVTLIAILEVDQLLALPDFRAGERTFQLIVQAAGRAGRAEYPGRVLIQCAKQGHPVVDAAIRQDFGAFAQAELAFRRAYSYPPFSRMIVFEFSSKKEPSLSDFSAKLEAWLEQLRAITPERFQSLRILGPSTPPIERLRGRLRRTLILSSKDQPSLRKMATLILEHCERLPADIRLTIDVDPQSLI